MEKKAKEKLKFENYLYFLRGYFIFILIGHTLFILGKMASLVDFLGLIILLLLLILFTQYVIGDFILKKDKMFLNQDKSSWTSVKICNSLTWIFSFITFISLVDTGTKLTEYNYLDSLVVFFSLLTILSVFLSNLSFNKIFTNEESMKYFFVKISLLTVFAGGLTLWAFTSIFGLIPIIMF